MAPPTWNSGFCLLSCLFSVSDFCLVFILFEPESVVKLRGTFCLVRSKNGSRGDNSKVRMIVLLVLFQVRWLSLSQESLFKHQIFFVFWPKPFKHHTRISAMRAPIRMRRSETRWTHFLFLLHFFRKGTTLRRFWRSEDHLPKKWWK